MGLTLDYTGNKTPGNMEEGREQRNSTLFFGRIKS
jgi:hypothetical protein